VDTYHPTIIKSPLSQNPEGYSYSVSARAVFSRGGLVQFIFEFTGQGMISASSGAGFDHQGSF